MNKIKSKFVKYMIRNNSIIYKFVAESDNINLKKCHLEFKGRINECCIYYQTNNILIKDDIIYVICPHGCSNRELRIWY